MCLRAPLSALARRKQPGELLFTEGTQPPSRQHFWETLHRFCRRAQVPVVCPHSLRGLHATLALEAGATSEMVAQALGHGSFQVTARHYATAESVASARAARVAEALGSQEDPISRLLAALSPTELEELKKWLSYLVATAPSSGRDLISFPRTSEQRDFPTGVDFYVLIDSNVRSAGMVIPLARSNSFAELGL